MLASAVELAAPRPNIPGWLRDQRTLAQLCAIIALALLSLGLNVFTTSRTWDARQSVGHSREVQLAIDQIVRDLLDLQQAAQSLRLDRTSENVEQFDRVRARLGEDTEAARALTADNSLQQDLLAEFGELLTHHLAAMDKVAASAPGSGVGRGLAPSMSADATRMSLLIAKMREHEDALLQARSARADNLTAVMLPTLCFSAAFIALLIVMLAQSINRLIRERDQSESEKETELAATEMMMREVDHRVRNSLGLVYNLLTLQQRRKGVDVATQGFLAEAANQILVVARMHERLYRSGAPQRLRIDHYLADLCNDVAAYALPAESRSAIRVNAAEVDVPAERAVWLGLIVVEFVTNALKYGSPTPQSPIRIDLARVGEGLRVEVSDQGHGLPEDFDPKACKGLGMQVVVLLVKQLHGVLAIDRTWAGARFVVTIPADAAVAVHQ